MGAGGRGFCCPRKESAQVAGVQAPGWLPSSVSGQHWAGTQPMEVRSMGWEHQKMMLSWGHWHSPGTLPWSFRLVLPVWLRVEPITLLGASPHLLYHGPHPETVPRGAIKRTFAPCPSHHCSVSPVQKRANPDLVKMLCLKAPLKRCQG